MKHLLLVLACISFILTGLFGALPCSAQSVDFELRLNDGGFVSFDPFEVEIVFRNSGDVLPDARVFAILEVFGEFFFWPDFSSRFDYEVMDILAGETNLTVLNFTFPDIDDFIPLGPLYFWGAWFQEQDNQGIDVIEFWLDEDHKWTPTPPPLTPTPTSPPMTPTPFDQPGAIYAVDPIVGNLRCIPSGSFVQGSPETEPCRVTNETQFDHALSRNMAGMETEVSVRMWEFLRAVQPSLPFKDGYSEDRRPIKFVTWHEAILFANLLSQYGGYPRCYYSDPQMTVPIDGTNYLEGQYYCDFDATGYRLPTEGEWEYICRAGTTGAFSCEEPDYNAENCDSCDAGVHPVLEQYCIYCASDLGIQAAGSRLPNPWNFYDMHGNVFEWCWDWSGPYPESGTDFTGAATGFYRVARGGSYAHEASLARSAFRAGILPHIPLNHLGFRLVRTIN